MGLFIRGVNGMLVAVEGKEIRNEEERRRRRICIAY